MLLALVLALGAAQEPPPQPSLLDVVEGTLPIVISAPHGGSLRPEGWPVRQGGVHARDTNTYEIAHAMAEAIRRRTGQMPYLVAAKVHRRHLDLNRDDLESGALQGEAQFQLWSSYHRSIENAAQAALQRGEGKAILIDLHGHGHEHGLIELGFAISAEQLRKPDDQLQDPAWVRGPKSLGARLDKLGFKSVPSPTRPAPEVGQEYFNGGYTVRRHRGNGLRSIQIELPPQPRRQKAEARQVLVEALAEACLGLLKEQVGLPTPPFMRQPSAEARLFAPGDQPWSRSLTRDVSLFAKELPHVIRVYGMPVLAPADFSAEDHRAAARLIAQQFDEDLDGYLDDEAATRKLQLEGSFFVLYDRRKPKLPRGDQSPWSNAQLVTLKSLQREASR